MAQQTLNTGDEDSGGRNWQGDSIDERKTAYEKINANFAELYAGGGLTASQIRDLLLADADSAELLNGGAAVATQNPTATMVGDGSTDNLAAYNSIISAYNGVIIPEGTFLFSEPMDVVGNKTIRGMGNYRLSASTGTKIKGTSGQAAAIRVNTGGNARHVNLSGFTITGAADAAFYATSMVQSTMKDIAVSGTFTRGFDFNSNVFDCMLEHLLVTDSTISGENFYCGAEFNANVCNHLMTSNSGSHNFRVLGGTATTFNSLVAQNGTIGLAVDGGTGHVFNAYYSENIGTAVTLGVTGSSLVTSTVFNGGEFRGPGTGQSFYGARLTCIDVYWASGITFIGPDFLGCYNAYNDVTLDFDTSGGGTGARGIARVHPDGDVHSIAIVNGGSGYSDGPFAVGISGSGSSATATATASSGVIQSATVTDGGSGYSTNSKSPSALRLAGTARNTQITLINPVMRVQAGLNDPDYTAIVRATGCHVGSRVEIVNISTKRASDGSATGRMIGASGSGYQHYMEVLDNSGTLDRWSYVPPAMDT